ncbi:hypothetical protein ACT691_00665 [Vibrio metschnikovii]
MIDNAIQKLQSCSKSIYSWRNLTLDRIRNQTLTGWIGSGTCDYQQQYRQASNALAILFEQDPEQAAIEIDQQPAQALPLFLREYRGSFGT